MKQSSQKLGIGPVTRDHKNSERRGFTPVGAASAVSNTALEGDCRLVSLAMRRSAGLISRSDLQSSVFRSDSLACMGCSFCVTPS